MPELTRVVPALAGVAVVVFCGFVAYRLLRSVQRGLSIRMQVFLGMALVSIGCTALFFLTPRVPQVRDAATRLSLLVLLLVLGTASVAVLVGRAIAKPIERLTLSASRIAHGEHNVQLPRPFGREVRTLTAAVESMRQELEGRNLAEQLATDLSHQLKNLVAGIRASAEVLADGALEEPAVAQQFVGRIREATERLRGLVDNLLALTRVEARGVAMGPVDLAMLVRASADAHSGQAEQRRLAILVDAPSQAMVHGDPLWLQRAIDNLVDNALGFAVADGSAPAVRLRVVVQEHEVRLEVENTGPGIAPEIRERLFERFVTTRRESGGTGLGLAIVAAVAEKHGGSVEVAAYGPPVTRLLLRLPRARLHEIFP